MIFTDRTQAGSLLAEKLSSFRGKIAIVLGLARGGILTAGAVADILKLPLDVLVVKKVGAPGQEELAIGALAPDDVASIDWRFAQALGVDEEYISRVIRDTREVIREKTLLYRKKRKPYKLRTSTVVLVDDGAATGATMEAAIKWCKIKHAKRIIVALPVAPKEFVERVKHTVDNLVVLESPTDFSAVGQWYTDFKQVEDGDVVELLRRDTNQRMHANATN